MEVTGYGKNAISMEQGLTLNLTQESTECPIYLVHISQIEEVLASRILAEKGNSLIESGALPKKCVTILLSLTRIRRHLHPTVSDMFEKRPTITTSSSLLKRR